MILIDKILINCKQATYLHEKKKEGKLDAMERFGLWVHLLYCKFCRLFIKQVEQLESATRKFYQNTERFNLTPERKAEIQKAFDDKLNG
jgi:predicted anti-sigma-YlaC factor YlaD